MLSPHLPIDSGFRRGLPAGGHHGADDATGDALGALAWMLLNRSTRGLTGGSLLLLLVFWIFCVWMMDDGEDACWRREGRGSGMDDGGAPRCFDDQLPFRGQPADIQTLLPRELNMNLNRPSLYPSIRLSIKTLRQTHNGVLIYLPPARVPQDTQGVFVK
jgi:hypothetical protein